MTSSDKSEPVTGTPKVPVSWGELFDKISILNIKKEKFQDPVARAGVCHEVEQLSEITARLPKQQELLELITSLTAINLQLWDIEDAIRVKEAKQQFDDQFIKLARSVYHTNDQRARVKREINNLLGSDLQEYKSYQAY